MATLAVEPSARVGGPVVAMKWRFFHVEMAAMC